MCDPTAYAALRVFQAYNSYKTDKDKANRINQNAVTNAKNIREEAIYKDNSLIRKKEIEEDKISNKQEKLGYLG